MNRRENTTTTFKEKKRKVRKDQGGKALWSLEKIIAQTSRVDNSPYFKADLFDWSQKLGEHPVIRHELNGILQHLDQIPNFQQISKDQKSITRDDKWKTYFCTALAIKRRKLCPVSGNNQAHRRDSRNENRFLFDTCSRQAYTGTLRPLQRLHPASHGR